MHAPEGGTTTLHPSFSFQRTFFPMHLPSLLTGQRYNALGRSASSVIHPAFLPVQSTGVACTRPGLGVGGPHVSGFSCQPTKTASGPSDSTLPTFSTCAAAMSPRSQREHATPHTSFTIDAILGAAEEKNAHEASDLRTRGLLGTRHQPYPLQQRPYTQRKDAIAPYHGCLSRSLNSYPRDYRLPEQKASQNDRKSSPSGDLSPLPWKQNKSKRVRTIFTPEQLERLEAEFERQQYMVGTERYYLAASLNLTEGQVKVWFQNRRIKWRKHSLEMQHAKMAGRSDIFLPAEETSETDEERELIASRDHLRETPEADDRRDGGVDEYGDLVIDNCTESLGVNGDLSTAVIFQCEGLDASSLVSNENDEV